MELWFIHTPPLPPHQSAADADFQPLSLWRRHTAQQGVLGGSRLRQTTASCGGELWRADGPLCHSLPAFPPAACMVNAPGCAGGCGGLPDAVANHPFNALQLKVRGEGGEELGMGDGDDL